jgi:SAM-dependent methyltransferase
LLSADQITLAYQLFLGRDPENQDVVNNLVQTTHSVEELRKIFVTSPEFVQQMAEALQKPAAVRQRHPFTLPHIPVETDVTDDVLDQMFARIQKQWEALGVSQPYWSVVTQPQYYQDQFEQHSEQFFLSGKYSSDLFLSALRRNGISPDNLHTCLEVGCGVGRVTKFLAESFTHVIACDISNAHIQLGMNHLSQHHLHNVEWVHWQDMTQLQHLPQVDAIFSVITLQHNPPPVMAWMLKQLLDSLNPGGAAYIQFPTYRNGYFFEVDRYLHTPPPQTLEMHFLPQRDVFQVIESCGCRCLEIREDGMVGDEDKMLSNTFLIVKP